MSISGRWHKPRPMYGARGFLRHSESRSATGIGSDPCTRNAARYLRSKTCPNPDPKHTAAGLRHLPGEVTASSQQQATSFANNTLMQTFAQRGLQPASSSQTVCAASADGRGRISCTASVSNSRYFVALHWAFGASKSLLWPTPKFCRS